MTDMKALSEHHTSEAAKRYLRRRRFSQTMLKSFGVLAILFAVTMLAILVYQIGSKALQGIYVYRANVDISFAANEFDPEELLDDVILEAIEAGNLDGDRMLQQATVQRITELVQFALAKSYRGAHPNLRPASQELLVHIDPAVFVAQYERGAFGDGATVRQEQTVLPDDAQLLLKGLAERVELNGASTLEMRDLVPTATEYVPTEDEQLRFANDPNFTGVIGEVAVRFSESAVERALQSIRQRLLVLQEERRKSAALQDNGVQDRAGFLRNLGVDVDALNPRIDAAIDDAIAAGADPSNVTPGDLFQRLAADPESGYQRTIPDGLDEEAREDAQELKRALEDYARRWNQRRKFTFEADNFGARAAAEELNEVLDTEMPSVLIFTNGGAIKLTRIENNAGVGDVYVPLTNTDTAQAGEWQLVVLDTPEVQRRTFLDGEIILIGMLEREGRVASEVNLNFFSDVDSRQAELAGFWVGLVGSFWTMLVTFFIAFPIGVMAAIYLEEFARKGWFTDVVEININNLAAIPSIIFGLFGLLLLLSGFKIPIGEGGVNFLESIGFSIEQDDAITIGAWLKDYRSAPLVGGIVLALMTLPTIIIAARASIRAVPPSIRAAALGIGASKVQSVFHHVLPLAMPGIMTGVIIGMAQALGETAPLLLIGMNAFVLAAPGSPLDPSSVMPTQVFSWADKPEQLFDIKTSMAIVTLLFFLVAMNAIAIFLRKRFERRW